MPKSIRIGLIALGCISSTTSVRAGQSGAAQADATPAKPTPPVIIKVEPTREGNQPSENQKAVEGGLFGINADGWVAIFTAVLSFSTILLWLATRRAVLEAKASSERQASDMAKHITEAAKSAAAMENVAAALEASGREQTKFGKLQMRAYLTVLIGDGLYQDVNLRFQANPVILNTGNTAAHSISYRIAAGILPIPVPDDFKFSLPGESKGNNTLGAQQNATMSGLVENRIPDEEVTAVKGMNGKALYVWGALRA